MQATELKFAQYYEDYALNYGLSQAKLFDKLMGATQIRFINTEPSPREVWKRFWKLFFELRDKHR